MIPKGYILKFALIGILVIASPAYAQDVSITLDNDGSLATRSIQLFVLITILSIVPGIAIMITCFPFMVTVLSILRQGIGLQQSPPNMLIISLALFLTYFVMEPVFVAAWASGIDPLLNDGMPLEDAFLRVMEPFRAFMANRIAPDTFEELASLRP
ncbi:MAG: flagellar biosynthetic protein FliP, partial [Octadecabacter sp.]|nr:flagellar biosynthetic protein FliP [Octadecabacter sp.]